MRPRVVAIVGPTAVGKSELGIAVARRFGGEVVSGDAFQFYRGLDIGTAKTVPAAQQGIPHHLIDVLEPTASFSAADYQRLVRAKIAELESRNVLPVLVGGSGFYVQAALYDYRFSGVGRDPAGDPVLDHAATGELYALLERRNPALAATVEPDNRRRILRALEIDASAGDAVDRESGRQRYYEPLAVIGLTMPRERLNARIDARVDAMFAAGFVAEAERLRHAGIGAQAAAAIGYRELFRHFEGGPDLAETIALVKLHTRQYAKRQMTWFRNRMDAVWFTADSERPDQTAAAVLAHLERIFSE